MKLSEAGVVWTHPKLCKPLEDVKIVFKWDGLCGQDVQFEVTDASHKPYIIQTVTSGQGETEININAAGASGVHFIRVVTTKSDGTVYHRAGSFRLEAKTEVVSDNKVIDELLKLLEEALRQTLDVVMVNGKRITYYKAADNSRENIAYPAFAVPALRYFISDLKSMFETLYENQWPSGRLPDHIYGDGHPYFAEGTTEGGRKTPRITRKIRTIMADLETGSSSMLCKAWQAIGDDKWIGGLLQRVEKSLRYITTDPRMFEPKHKLIKRAHTTDEWDIQIPGDDCFFTKDTQFVLMPGDTSGFYETASLLSGLYEHLGNVERAKYWKNQQDHYYNTGNSLFWDGTKYQHHIHLDDIDHGDFDEKDQLGMSNAWAVTRGFADHEKSVSILKEYLRRLESTGDSFPWWSLQPGYPDSLGYFSTEGAWAKKQGEYCNGGLFPWVGGELCRGAFEHGMEDLACRMLIDVHSVMKRDNGALFTWYNLDGTAAFNSYYNGTNYDPWGIAPWTQAVIEELVGIQSVGSLFTDVRCCPRWLAASASHAVATAHFPASDTYFSYTYDLSDDHLCIRFTGTGEKVIFHLLLPPGKQCKAVTIDKEEVEFITSTVETSTYIDLEISIFGCRELTLSM